MNLTYLSSGERRRVLEAILSRGHVVEQVIVTDPAKWPRVAETVRFAQQNGIPVRIVSKRDLPQMKQDVQGRICLSAGFAYILPPSLIKAARVFLNVHGTLLPKYRGARTLNWVIACGEMKSGVTVHVIDEGVDTGPILLQREFAVSPFETGRSLRRKTLEFEPQVVLEALDLYEAQGLSGVRAQEPYDVVHPNRVPAHSRIDPTKPLIELYNQIRAADPDHYPAFFEIEGQKVCIRLWRPNKPPEEADLV